MPLTSTSGLQLATRKTLFIRDAIDRLPDAAMEQWLGELRNPCWTSIPQEVADALGNLDDALLRPLLRAAVEIALEELAPVTIAPDGETFNN
jgi:hypothetical protein